MAKLTETGITTACIKWIIDQRGDAWHVHGSPLQRSGEPDICGEIRDENGNWHHLKIEVKTPTGKLSVLQALRLDRYGKRGYIVGVVTSVDELERLINEQIANWNATGRYTVPKAD